MSYYLATPKEIECYRCGEMRICEIRFSDPERETGYVDEIAVCGECSMKEVCWAEGAPTCERR